MGIIAIACYKSVRGKESKLKEIVLRHTRILLRENLITGRPAVICKSKDGIIIEIFEWKSAGSKNRAHKNQKILKLWELMEKNSKNISLKNVKEAKEIFANFKPIN